MESVVNETILRKVLHLDILEESKELKHELFPEHTNYSYLLTGPRRSGKTSLMFEYAFQAAENDLNVLFIKQKIIETLPHFIGQRKQPSMKTLKLIEIVYLSTVNDLLKLMSNMHLRTKRYNLVLVDDMDVFYSVNGHHDIKIAAKVSSFTYDAVTFLRKAGLETFLISSTTSTKTSHKVTSDTMNRWFSNVISFYPHHNGTGFVIRTESNSRNNTLVDVDVKSIHATFKNNEITLK